MSVLPPLPSLELTCLPDRTVLRFTGCDTLDEHNCHTVSQRLSMVLDSVVGERLVLDLDGIHYVTSTALGTLVSFNRRVRSAGGKFALVNVSPFVREALTVTRLDQLLEILSASEDTAPTANRLSA